jgi:hypothetical protein
MAETTQQSKGLGLNELQKTAAWGTLTPKQARFVSEYVRTGATGSYDAVSAARATYKCSSERNLSNMAAEALANPKVRAVLARHFGTSDRQLLIEDLEKAAATSTGIAKVQALALLARLKLNLNDEPQRDQQTDETYDGPRIRVGEHFTQEDGHTYRATSVDERGKPLTAEEVA